MHSANPEYYSTRLRQHTYGKKSHMAKRRGELPMFQSFASNQ